MFFHYKALKDGQVVEAKIDANNEAEVIDYLKSQKLFPVEVKRMGDGTPNFITKYFHKSISVTDIANFTRQLSLMLNAGLTLIDALEILKGQSGNSSLNRIIDDVSKELKGGKSFSQSIAKYPRVFSNLYIALLKAGEASGKLGEIIVKLADNLEKEREFKGKVKNAMIYPSVIILAVVVMLFVMLTFVVPKLLEMYKNFNIELPATTQFVILVSDFFVNNWILLIIGFFGTITGTKAILRTPQGKNYLDHFVLKVPAISKIVKMSNLVDATRTFSILIGSGVSILDSLAITSEATANVVYQNAFKKVYTKVEQGMSMGKALESEGIFPNTLVQMTIVGEQTGHLDETLVRISNFYQIESELEIKTMMTLIEPAILAVLGVVVGFLVIAVITPIYSLTDSFNK